MKLYFNPASSNCRKVLFVATHLGIEHERELVDLRGGQQRTPEFLKLNPNGKVPVLTDGELVLWESNAIMGYLAGQKDNSLWPKTNARYDIMRWMFWESGHLQPAAGKLLSENYFKGMRGETPNPELVKAGEADFSKYAAVLNGHLETHRWLAGDGPTLADVAVASVISWREIAKLPLDGFKHIGEWYGRFEALDAWKATAPKR